MQTNNKDMKITRENARQFLRYFILHSKTTQKEIAEQSGLTPNCINTIVTGGRKPQTITVMKLNGYVDKIYNTLPKTVRAELSKHMEK